MSLADRVRAAFGFGATSALEPQQRGHKSQNAFMASTGSRWGALEPRRGARTMRRFSETNVWVRTAINRRKREISHAKWAIVRVDDDKAAPVPKVVQEATNLFNFINDTRVSLSWLLNMLVEDILVLDAAIIEKEHTASGKLVALWPIDGASIAPDPNWNGNPRSPRYQQFVGGRPGPTFLNDELIYMMANPRSCSAVGLSPLEVLFDTVEADLYAEDFEFRMMQETAPPGMLYLGSGMSAEQVEMFRVEWENEIAANRDLAIFGGGAHDDGSAPQAPTYTPFARSAREEQRREYMKWLATKVAAAFEMDLLAFNLSESVHRSVGETMRSKTDDGLVGLAGLIASFITREILWEIDPKREHGFTFVDLVKRDAMTEAKIAAIWMGIGCTTPNEQRALRGFDPVPWGDQPWPAATAKAYDPAQPPDENEPTAPAKPPDATDDEDDDESA